MSSVNTASSRSPQRHAAGVCWVNMWQTACQMKLNYYNLIVVCVSSSCTQDVQYVTEVLFSDRCQQAAGWAIA